MFNKTINKNKRKFSPSLLIITVFLLSIVGGNLLSFFSRNNNQAILKEQSNYLFSEDSFLVASSNPNNPPLKVVKEFETVITAYSSTECQTDSTPFITASNKRVEDGIIANNYFPFGTKVRIPELYGDKVFVVEDRMHSRKSDYQFDVWHSDYGEAVNFGAQKTKVEILGRE